MAGQIRIKHHITNVAPGLKILRDDIYIALKKNFGQASKHSRDIAMNLTEPHPRWVGLQLDLREIDRPNGGTA